MKERIKLLMAQLGVSQTRFAALMDIHPSSVAHYLYGEREPDRVTCLLFAAIAKSEEDQEFFIRAAKLTPKQLALLGSWSHVKGSPSDKKQRSLHIPAELLPYVRSLIDYFRAPNEVLSPVEIAFRESMKAVLDATGSESLVRRKNPA